MAASLLRVGCLTLGSTEGKEIGTRRQRTGLSCRRGKGIGKPVQSMQIKG